MIKRRVSIRPGRLDGFTITGRLVSVVLTPFVRFDLPGLIDRPGEGPVVWAPNHRSMFDTAVGLVGLYRLGYTASFFVTARYFTAPTIGKLLRFIGAVPVDVERGALTAIGHGVQLLRDGRSLVVMAEGRLVSPTDRTDGIGVLEPGVAILARRAGVPIIPAALIGADEILPIGQRVPRFSVGRRKTIVVRFGPPIPVDDKPEEIMDLLATELSDLVVRAETEARAEPRAR